MATNDPYNVAQQWPSATFGYAPHKSHLPLCWMPSTGMAETQRAFLWQGRLLPAAQTPSSSVPTFETEHRYWTSHPLSSILILIRHYTVLLPTCCQPWPWATEQLPPWWRSQPPIAPGLRGHSELSKTPAIPMPQARPITTSTGSSCSKTSPPSPWTLTSAPSKLSLAQCMEDANPSSTARRPRWETSSDSSNACPTTCSLATVMARSLGV
jgi:hypothetical protein